MALKTTAQLSGLQAAMSYDLRIAPMPLASSERAMFGLAASVTLSRTILRICTLSPVFVKRTHSGSVGFDPMTASPLSEISLTVDPSSMSRPSSASGNSK